MPSTIALFYDVLTGSSSARRSTLKLVAEFSGHFSTARDHVGKNRPDIFPSWRSDVVQGWV